MKATTLNLQFKVGNVSMMEVELTTKEGRLLYNALQCYRNALNRQYDSILENKCIDLVQPSYEMLQDLLELNDKLKDLDI